MERDKMMKPTKRKGINRVKRNNYIFCYLCIAYPVLLCLIFYVYVHIDSFVMAFQNISIDSASNSYVRSFVGLSNFLEILNDIKGNGLILKSFKNSIYMHYLMLFICMPLYLIFSYLIFKKVRGHKLVMALTATPAVVSSFIYAIAFRNFASLPLQKIMQEIGFKNFPNLLDDYQYTYGTMIFYMIFTSFYINLVTYSNAMRQIDPALYESAQIDGMSNMFQELFYIILPQIYPTIVTFLVTGFAGIFSQQGPLVLFFQENAPAEAYNVGYYMFKEVAYKSYSPVGYPIISAMGLLLTLLVAPITLILNKVLNALSPMKDV